MEFWIAVATFTSLVSIGMIAALKIEAINFRNELKIQREKLTEARRDIFSLEKKLEAKAPGSPLAHNRDSVSYWRNEIAQMVEDADYYGVKVTATAQIPLD